MNGKSSEGTHSGPSNEMINLMHQGHIPGPGNANLFQTPPYLYLAYIIIWNTLYPHPQDPTIPA